MIPKPVTLLTTKLIEAFCPDALNDLGDEDDDDAADGIGHNKASKQSDWFGYGLVTFMVFTWGKFSY